MHMRLARIFRTRRQRSSRYIRHNFVMDMNHSDPINTHVNGNSQNETSSNLSTVDLSNDGGAKENTKKRKRYCCLNDDECKRLVEDTSKSNGSDVDTTCMICFDKVANAQLIHLTNKDGAKKENLCTYRLCFDCVIKSIAAQELGRDDVCIVPRCPCCKQPVGKVVKLDEAFKPVEVCDLPKFTQQKPSHLFDNAKNARLYFCYNFVTDEVTQKRTLVNYEIIEDITEFDFEGEDVKISTPNSILINSFHIQKPPNQWEMVFKRSAVFTAIPLERGWPSPSELQSALKRKLKEIGKLDLSWLPAIYGGTMEVLKTLPEAKKIKVISLV